MNRKINNTIAFGIVACFWIILVIPTVVQAADPIVTQATSTVDNNTTTTTTVKTNPPSAISPSINASNSDICVIGVSGAVQTQILGLSSGLTVRDISCERLKLSKLLHDLGMKVAAVSILCQDERVFRAMANSGTYCPASGGLIGLEAKKFWDENPELQPQPEKQPLKKGEWLEKGINGFISLILLAVLAR